MVMEAKGVKGKKKIANPFKRGALNVNPLKKAIRSTVGASSMSQLCLESVKMLDVIKAIPEDINIVRILCRNKAYPKTFALKIPKELHEKGVRSARELQAKMEIAFTLTGSRSKMLKDIKDICEHYRTEPTEFYARTLILEKDDASTLFNLTLKEIRLPHDKRQKVRVLGLDSVSRDPKLEPKVNSLLASLSAKKYNCKFMDASKRIVVCSTLS